MKKKIFFVIVSLIEIISFIYVIYSANGIVENEIELMEQMSSFFPQEMQNQMINSLVNNGKNMIVMYSSIGIAMCLITIYIAFKDRILRNKSLLIVFSVLHIVFAMNILNEILPVITILVLLCLKRKNPEDFPIKRELPEIEKKNTSKIEVIIGIVLALVYFSQFLWKDIIPESVGVRIAISIIFYLGIFLLAIAFWNKKLIEYFKTFGKNFITYVKFILPRLIGMYFIYFIVAIISVVITGEIGSVNQDNLESMNKFVVIPLAIIWAPIVEETIFRGLIHKIIKNKYLYIIISAVSFGLLHTFALEANVLNTVVKAMPYAVLGGFLAYVYDKSKNISASMFCHSLINIIASAISFI